MGLLRNRPQKRKLVGVTGWSPIDQTAAERLQLKCRRSYLARAASSLPRSRAPGREQPAAIPLGYLTAPKESQ
jgi:hypothetical protein